MKLINSKAIIDNEFDEDLKSELIATTIKYVRQKKIYKKFLK